jgi:hypothetical protein
MKPELFVNLCSDQFMKATKLHAGREEIQSFPNTQQVCQPPNFASYFNAKIFPKLSHLREI